MTPRGKTRGTDAVLVCTQGRIKKIQVNYHLKSELNGSFLIPNIYTLIIYTCCFLYYFFCLCKRFKELFSECFPRRSRGRFSFSGCKGTAFFQTTKIFMRFFFKNGKKNSNLDRNQPEKAVFGLKVWLFPL